MDGPENFRKSSFTGKFVDSTVGRFTFLEFEIGTSVVALFKQP